MRFLLEHTRPDADVEAPARAYVARPGLARRAALAPRADHPACASWASSTCVAARDRGRGVMLNFMHHGTYEGAFASLGRLGRTAAHGRLPLHARATTRRAGSSSTCASACTGGGVRGQRRGRHRRGSSTCSTRARSSPSPPTSRAVRRSASSAATCWARSAPPGSPPTPGRPVVVMTSEFDDARPVRPAARAARARRTSTSPQALLRRCSRVTRRWSSSGPRHTDLPLSRWGSSRRVARPAMSDDDRSPPTVRPPLRVEPPHQPGVLP